MTIISVERVTDDTTTCRRCGRPIERGRRAVLVLDAGLVHLRYLLDGSDGESEMEA